MNGDGPRSARADDRGAAAVEFAMVLPLLLLLVFGIVDFARAYNANVTVTHAAREGARSLALGNDAATVATTAENAASPLAVLVGVGACTPGDPASVTVSHSFNYVTPIGPIAGLLGGGSPAGPITIASIGTMRCGG